MYTSKIRILKTIAFAGRQAAITRAIRLKQRLLSTAFSCLLLAGSIILLAIPSSGATYTLNVSLSTSTVNPASLQQEILSNLTTGQYLGSSTASPYFANTYSVVIKGKNPLYAPPAPPTVSTEIVNLDTIVKRMVDVSTWSYVYGFGNGMDYERNVDMNRITTYVINCSTPSYFGVGLTTSNWNTGVCTTALSSAETDIYNLRFSTPTLIPPLPIIFDTQVIGVSTGPVSNVVLHSATTLDCYQLKVQPNGTVFTTFVTCPK